MKKIALMMIAVTAVLGLAASSFAQAAGPNGGKGQPGQGQGERRGGGMRMGGGKEMMEALKLTDAQKKSWEAVNKDMRAEMMKAFGGQRPGGNPAGGPPKPGQGGQGQRMQISPEQRAKMQAIMEKYQPKFMAILDANQKKTYAEMMKKRMEQMKKLGGQAGKGGKDGKGGGA